MKRQRGTQNGCNRAVPNIGFFEKCAERLYNNFEIENLNLVKVIKSSNS